MWSLNLHLVQFKLILLLIWLFSEYKHVDGTRLQMFTLYDDTGQSENYTTSIRDLEKVSNLVKSQELTSVCSQVGVWAFFSNKDFADKDAYGYHPATPEWTCNSRRIGADHGFAAVTSIRHLGSGDLDISALSLYKEPYFASDELFFDGDIISLPITHKFYSFGFTGNESWTLYQNTNFTGDMVCLRPNTSDDSGVTYKTERLLIVGSIVKGCIRTPRLLPIGEVYRQNDSQTREFRFWRFGSPELIYSQRVRSNRYKKSIPDMHWAIVPEIRENGGPNISDLISKKSNSPIHCLELQDEFYSSPLLVSGNELRLPEPEPFDSFTLQKNSSWTIFKGMEFDGESMCLKNNESEMNSATEAINYKFVSPPFLVGSIRQGCEEKNETEVSNNDNSTRPSGNFNTSTQNSINGTVSSRNSMESSSTENPTESTTPTTETSSTDETDTTDPTDFGWTTISSRGDSSARRGKTFFDNNTPTPTYDIDVETTTNMIPNSEIRTNFNNSGTSETAKNSSGTTSSDSARDSNSTTASPESLTNSSSTSRTTATKPIVEPNVTSTKVNTTKSENLKNSNSTENKPEELVSNAGSGGLFFTAFIIVLGLLILCMLITLGLFVYFRATRHRPTDELAG